MTNHPTPGAKALLDEGYGTEVVDVVSVLTTRAIVQVKGGSRIDVAIKDLTPLLTAVVQEDGTVREVNPLGNSPRTTATFQEFAVGHEKVFEDQIHNEKWQAAESQRRTWEVDKFAAFCMLAGNIESNIGTTVLGYVPAGKFLIVEVVK